MKENKLSLVFTGDIGFSRYFKDSWKDKDLIDPELISFCRNADHVIANVEGSVIAPEKTAIESDKTLFLHYTHAGAGDILDQMGTDVWCLANNHAMDLGTAGLESTLLQAKAHGAKTVGAGLNIDEASRPVYFPEAGGIGILALGFANGCPAAEETKEGLLNYDCIDVIRQRIEEIKQTCRWCIVICHDGEEFTCLPQTYVRDRFFSYLDMGADIVVAHHPHVPMPYEWVGEKKAIFYSLGNFIFDTDYQRAQVHTDTGLLLKLSFTSDSFTMDAKGTKICRETQKLKAGPLPAVFTPVSESDYRALLPLASRAFIAAEKKRQIFMKPEAFSSYTDQEWKTILLDPNKNNYEADAHMDFAYV